VKGSDYLAKQCPTTHMLPKTQWKFWSELGTCFNTPLDDGHTEK